MRISRGATHSRKRNRRPTGGSPAFAVEGSAGRRRVRCTSRARRFWRDRGRPEGLDGFDLHLDRHRGPRDLRGIIARVPEKFWTRDSGHGTRTKLLLVSAFAAVAFACATRPRPTAEAVRRSTNPRAVVEGRVRDPLGHAIGGISVQALPREKNVVWSPAAVTDDRGRFRLDVIAPGEYGFVISWQGITVITSKEDDPSRTLLRLAPGERRTGIELVFRREEWERALISPRNP